MELQSTVCGRSKMLYLSDLMKDLDGRTQEVAQSFRSRLTNQLLSRRRVETCIQKQQAFQMIYMRKKFIRNAEWLGWKYTRTLGQAVWPALQRSQTGAFARPHSTDAAIHRWTVDRSNKDRFSYDNARLHSPQSPQNCSTGQWTRAWFDDSVRTSHHTMLSFHLEFPVPYVKV